MDSQAVEVYLGLGSNMGNRRENLEKAINLLTQRLQMAQISSIYETEPIGDIKQADFLNLVCQIYTGLSPQGLLLLAKGIESKLGRVSGESGAPRPIDIDILFYGDQIVEEQKLIIPHPKLTERLFVLIPLVEIAGDLKHPVMCKTAKELLVEVQDHHSVIKWENV